MAKLSKTNKTEQWMLDHPDDTPCPRSPFAARAWRTKRGIGVSGKDAALWRKYEEAMAAKRAALAEASV